MASLGTPIDEIDLSPDAARAVRALGVRTVGELLALPSIRASAPVVAELRFVFDDRGLVYRGALEAVPHDVPPERRVPVLHVRYVEGGPPTATTRIGGLPSSWGAAGPAWPQCEKCARPLRFVGQIAGPLALSGVALDAGEAVQLFACLDESSECPSWTPRGPANGAWLRRIDDAVTKRGAAPFAAWAMETTPAFDDVILLDQHAAGDAKAWREALAHGQHDKLGGIACAGDDATTPACASCNHPMHLLAQLGSDAVPSPFADGTMLVHLCPRKHAAALQYVR